MCCSSATPNSAKRCTSSCPRRAPRPTRPRTATPSTPTHQREFLLFLLPPLCNADSSYTARPSARSSTPPRKTARCSPVPVIANASALRMDARTALDGPRLRLRGLRSLRLDGWQPGFFFFFFKRSLSASKVVFCNMNCKITLLWGFDCWMCGEVVANVMDGYGSPS